MRATALMSVLAVAAWFGITEYRKGEKAREAADCMSRGMHAVERYKGHLAERYGDMVGPVNPQFHFNSRMNTCLMLTDHYSSLPYSGLGGLELDADEEHVLIDVYANKIIFATGFMDRWDRTTRQLRREAVGMNLVDFNQRIKRLMEE